MTDSIRLHPKYGLNPTMPVCFWCGEDRGEVALLGAAYKDEAPHRMVIDHEPCSKCAEKMAQGITLAEASRGSDGEPQYTGRWAVLREDAVARLFQPEAVVQSVLAARRALLDPEAFQALFAAAPKEDAS